MDTQKVRRNTIILLSGNIIILIAFLSYIWLKEAASMQEIIKSLLSSSIGVLLSLLIVELVINYFKDTYSDNTQQPFGSDESIYNMTSKLSNHLISNFMNNENNMNWLSDDQKRQFIERTVLSIVDGDEYKCDCAYNALSPYLGQFNYKKSFKYHIKLVKIPNALSTLFDPENYIAISEDVEYVKIFADKNKIRKFSIGFFIKEKDLDDKLRSGNYLFCNHFQVKSDDFSRFTSDLISIEDKKSFLDKIKFKIVIKNHQDHTSYKIEISDIRINEDSIIIDYNLDTEPLTNEIYFTYTCLIPLHKNKNTVFVSLVEPSKELLIDFSHEEDLNLKVSVHPYIEDNSNTRMGDWERGDNHYIINLESKNLWIYPHSGVVFVIEKINT